MNKHRQTPIPSISEIQILGQADYQLIHHHALSKNKEKQVWMFGCVGMYLQPYLMNCAYKREKTEIGILLYKGTFNTFLLNK